MNPKNNDFLMLIFKEYENLLKFNIEPVTYLASSVMMAPIAEYGQSYLKEYQNDH